MPMSQVGRSARRTAPRADDRRSPSAIKDGKLSVRKDPRIRLAVLDDAPALGTNQAAANLATYRGVMPD